VSVQDGRILKYEAATAHFVDFAFDSPARLDLEHLPYECLVIDIDFNKLRATLQKNLHFHMNVLLVKYTINTLIYIYIYTHGLIRDLTK